MKTLRFFGVLVCIVGLILAITVGAKNDDGFEWINGHKAAAKEVLIKFRDASLADIERAKMRGKIVYAEMIGGINAHRFRSSEKSVAALISLLAADPKVEYVEPNYILYADDVPGDPRYAELWGMDKISAPLAWDSARGSAAVSVGVVDTGIDYNHPDLAANVWSAPFAFSFKIGTKTKTCPTGAHGYNAIRGTFDPMDDNNHGTHVSGTIGAVGNNGIGVVGVNWTSSLMGLKFLNSQGSGSTSDAINAIEFAIQAKLAGAADVRVLSNSWGGGYSTISMLQEIERAYQNDMLFVCSAGNAGAGPVQNYYLPTYNVLNLLAVAASDRNDFLWGRSNYGYWSIHLAAPGVDVLSTIRRNSYDYYNGTSMAVPHVSGTAALVAAKWEGSQIDVNTDILRSILINTVDIVNQTPPSGYPDTAAKNIFGNTISNGRLNAFGAVSVDPRTVDPFPDFVMRFSPPMQTIVRGQTAEYVLTITSHFRYREDNLKVCLSCCSWSGVTILMQDPATGEWVNLDTIDPNDPTQLVKITVLLGENNCVNLNIRIETTPNAMPKNAGFTIAARDDKEGDEVGPFLYHNDTLYLNVTRR